MNRWLSAGVLAALLGVAPARAADVDWSRATRVDEVATEYKFTPDHLRFKAGTAYRLHIANRGKETHEFTAPEFFAAVAVRDPAVLNADHTEIVIPPGAAKDFYFMAAKPGRFPLRCSDHDWAGMTGHITVN